MNSFKKFWRNNFISQQSELEKELENIAPLENIVPKIKYYYIMWSTDFNKINVYVSYTDDIQKAKREMFYDLASRKVFSEESIAADYAKTLAKEFNIKYIGDTNNYLD